MRQRVSHSCLVRANLPIHAIAPVPVGPDNLGLVCGVDRKAKRSFYDAGADSEGESGAGCR